MRTADAVLEVRRRSTKPIQQRGHVAPSLLNWDETGMMIQQSSGVHGVRGGVCFARDGVQNVPSERRALFPELCPDPLVHTGVHAVGKQFQVYLLD